MIRTTVETEGTPPEVRQDWEQRPLLFGAGKAQGTTITVEHRMFGEGEKLQRLLIARPTVRQMQPVNRNVLRWGFQAVCKTAGTWVQFAVGRCLRVRSCRFRSCRRRPLPGTDVALMELICMLLVIL